MGSRFLAAKLAFILLALVTVGYQCAAQCVVEQCHPPGTDIPPCHRHSSTDGRAPADACKAPVLLMAEAPNQCEAVAKPPNGALLPCIGPELAGKNTGLPLAVHLWGPAGPPFPTEIELRTPLRI